MLLSTALFRAAIHPTTAAFTAVTFLSFWLSANVLAAERQKNAAESPPRPIVIAHRGASGYLPEHTLAAKALAYGMKVDYIEQDLVMSKDDHLIVMHDIYLDNITDVAQQFPGRARKDGHFYAIDFTLAELRQLQVSEPFTNHDGNSQALYPGRFPVWSSRFRLSTFEEELELIQGLNKSLGYNTGIYPEIKKPYFHHREGKDIASRTLDVLKQYGYIESPDKVFLQSFDAEELQRIHHQLMPAREMDLPLVQLIAVTDWGEKHVEKEGRSANYRYDWMLTPEGLEKISGYAQGIGPWFPMLVESSGSLFKADFKPNELTATAHSLGLKVHPYTFRADTEKLPAGITDFAQLVDFYVENVGVDGLFTDQPDQVIDYLDQRMQGREERKEPSLQAR